MIERIFDPASFNAVLNDEAVRRDVAGDELGELDISAIVGNQQNIVLQAEHGGLVFFYVLPGIYEVHTVTTMRGRGEWARSLVRAAARYMFTRTDAFEITTRIPREHVGARALAVSVGMSFDFEVEGGCVWRGKRMPIDVYSFRIQEWIRDAGECEEAGAWFHARLKQEAARIGITDEPHPDDEVHNRYVGAAVEMVRAGQVHKAANFYNRWCVAARHPTVQLLAVEPPTIKMDIGILRFVGGGIEVQQCQ